MRGAIKPDSLFQDWLVHTHTPNYLHVSAVPFTSSRFSPANTHLKHAIDFPFLGKMFAL